MVFFVFDEYLINHVEGVIDVKVEMWDFKLLLHTFEHSFIYAFNSSAFSVYLLSINYIVWR